VKKGIEGSPAALDLPFGLERAFGFTVIYSYQQVSRLTFQRAANFIEDSKFDTV
jgi:hypothetical protein